MLHSRASVYHLGMSEHVTSPLGDNVDWRQRPVSLSYVAVRDDGGLDTVVNGCTVYQGPPDPALVQLLGDIERQRRADAPDRGVPRTP